MVLMSDEEHDIINFQKYIYIRKQQKHKIKFNP